ncbi:MAG TPA: hypothetical protein VF602_01020 [Pedobacter sp.]|jgi:hypothetical protein
MTSKPYALWKKGYFWKMQSIKRNWVIALATLLLGVISISLQFADSSQLPAVSNVLDSTGKLSQYRENPSKYLILSHTLVQLHVREHSANPFTSGDLIRIQIDFKVRIRTLLRPITDVLNINTDFLSLLLFPFHSHW